ncbi:hypothetical protein HK104_000672 [Borealophlyctis nickersoniae]|nr:hypothetical protein HK104_000672 [Borealophlyctis nickersoniae]
MGYSDRDFIATLPAELVLQTFKHLKSTQIVRMGQTCKGFETVYRDNHLWRRLVGRRFGIEEGWLDVFMAATCIESKEPNTIKTQTTKLPWFDLYKALLHLAYTLPASTLTIHYLHPPAHPNHNRYWSLLSTHAHLTTVCWFDVSGTFRGLPTGTYTVIWTLKFSSPHGLDNILLSAASECGAGVETRLADVVGKGMCGVERDVWVDVRLPSITLGKGEREGKGEEEEFWNVDVSAVDHSYGWKCGVDIKGVRCERVV